MSPGHFWILWCCTWLAGRVLGRRVNGGAVAYPWIVALLQADSQPRLGTLLLISSPLLPPPSHPLLSSPPNTLFVPLQPPPPLIRAAYLAAWHRCIGEWAAVKQFTYSPCQDKLGFSPTLLQANPSQSTLSQCCSRRVPRRGRKVASHRVALGLRPREVYSSAWDVQGDKLYDLSPLGRC